MYNKKAVDAVRNALLKQHHSVSVAESVTAGHLQAAISLADRAMDFFQGGITVYNIGQKSRHLYIDPIYALSCNCVSARTADEMALGVSDIFSSDWGVSITGYAAPVPELNIKSVFAHYSIAFKGEIIESKKLMTDLSSAMEVQIYYANKVLARLATVVNAKKRSATE
jgi:nicotinamide-nucleotide amidase